jgi:hypothetical protein
VAPFFRAARAGLKPGATGEPPPANCSTANGVLS